MSTDRRRRQAERRYRAVKSRQRRKGEVGAAWGWFDERTGHRLSEQTWPSRSAAEKEYAALCANYRERGQPDDPALEELLYVRIIRIW